jgi:acetyltransferase-like isoleucine patch superfamily enzyme
VLGHDVGLAERVTVADSDHRSDGGTDRAFLSFPVVSTPVELGANVFIGTNAIVLRGARVGPGAIAAAGALVTGGEHPAGMLLVGAPATPRKPVGG